MTNKKSTPTKKPETQKRSNPSTPKMAEAKRRSKPSNPPIQKPSNPPTQKPSNPSTQKPSNSSTQKPSNSSTDKWEFYLDKNEKWRWKRTAPNGEIVGASTQGYAFKVDCVKNAERNGWRK